MNSNFKAAAYKLLMYVYGILLIIAVVLTAVNYITFEFGKGSKDSVIEGVCAIIVCFIGFVIFCYKTRKAGRY